MDSEDIVGLVIAVLAAAFVVACIIIALSGGNC
jgi:hypothetical protein